jgi:DNA repair protein RAD5
LLAQKKNGSATINEKSLKHFDSGAKLPDARRSASPTKLGDKGKGKASARNSDEEEDSGDEAEKLDDEQLGKLDNIYTR